MISAMMLGACVGFTWSPDVLLRFEAGPYRPAIDQELGGRTPYQDLFGEGPGILLRPTLATLWRHPFGTFGLKLSAGWFYVSERTLVDDGRSPTTSPSRSGGRTSLRVNPVTLGLVLRIETLAELTPIPLVPYGEADLGYTFWRIGKGNGRTARYEGELAEGGSPSWQIAGGLVLQLERLSKKSALSLKQQFGIHGTELSFGVVHLDASSLGAGPKLAVGGTTWLGGLALKF